MSLTLRSELVPQELITLGRCSAHIDVGPPDLKNTNALDVTLCTDTANWCLLMETCSLGGGERISFVDMGKHFYRKVSASFKASSGRPTRTARSLDLALLLVFLGLDSDLK